MRDDEIKRRNGKVKFWTVLALINIAAMIYPISLYIGAQENDDRGFSLLILVSAVFLLGITDIVSALVAYLQ